MGNIATLSRIAFRILNVIDRVQGVVDAVNVVIGAVGIMANQPYMDEAINTVKKNVLFSPREAVNSLGRNFKKILSRSFVPWSAWLTLNYRKVKGLLLYMPNPGLSNKTLPIKTGLKIGRLPVSLVFGGKNKSGTVFGVGFLAPGGAGKDQARQVWRMDFHKFHNAPLKSDELAVWRDDPFHYHVMKP